MDDPEKRPPPFERLTEESRRTLFFARHAVSAHGGSSIGTVHLLLGLLRAVPDLMKTVADPAGSPDRIREQLLPAVREAERKPPQVEIPFADELKTVFERALSRPDTADSGAVKPGHLLLELLESGDTFSASVLRSAGVTRERITAFLSGP